MTRKRYPEIVIPGLDQVTAQDVLREVWPLLTESRRSKIEQVISKRWANCQFVLESIYDRGNISAVMRSAEAFGFSHFHVIETQEKFKESARVTAGADKWLEVKKWKSSKECIQHLKAHGVQLVVTCLSEKSVPISQVNFQKPTALVLGNEKDGVSEEMQESADVLTVLPMTGFVQSFNISVAGALSAYHMWQELRKTGAETDLTPAEQEHLKALYALRTLDSAEDILRQKLT